MKALRLVCALVLLSPCPPVSGEPCEDEREPRKCSKPSPKDWRESMVQIQKFCYREGQVHNGAGVVVAVSAGTTEKLYILTAHHVVAICDNSYHKDWLKVFHTWSGTQIQVQDSPKTISPRGQGKDNNDLAVFIGVPKNNIAENVQAIRIAPKESPESPTRVCSVGNYLHLKWSTVSGDIVRGENTTESGEAPTRLVHCSPGYDEGFSGGPILNEKGELVGINAKRSSVGVTAVGTSIDGALRLDNNQRNIPLGLLNRTDEAVEEAFMYYRMGLRKMASGKYHLAIKHLDSAEEKFSGEGRRIRLHGMRFSVYSPSLFLGVNKVRLAERLIRHSTAEPGDTAYPPTEDQTEGKKGPFCLLSEAQNDFREASRVLQNVGGTRLTSRGFRSLIDRYEPRADFKYERKIEVLDMSKGDDQDRVKKKFGDTPEEGGQDQKVQWFVASLPVGSKEAFRASVALVGSWCREVPEDSEKEGAR